MNKKMTDWVAAGVVAIIIAIVASAIIAIVIHLWLWFLILALTFSVLFGISAAFQRVGKMHTEYDRKQEAINKQKWKDINKKRNDKFYGSGE